MDVYSRSLSVFPRQTLKTNEVVKILDQFLTNNIYKYTKFFTDGGVEFTNELMRKL